MGAFADSLFTLLLGWVRGLVGAITTLFSSGGENGLIPFLGRNWLVIVLTILVIGLVGDWFIWMLRWQPYRVWGTNMRRIARALHLRPRSEEETEEAAQDAGAPYAPPVQEDIMGGTRLYQRAAQTQQNAADADEENIDFVSEAEFDLPPLTPEEEAEAYAAADSAQDAQEYPGMHYDQSAYMRPAQETTEETVMPEAAEAETEAEAEAYAPEWFDNPDFSDGQEDGEWAEEIDPLASYDDPQVLAHLAQQEAWEAPVYAGENMQEDEIGQSEEQMPVYDEPVQEEQPRRRRRRRSEME